MTSMLEKKPRQVEGPAQGHTAPSLRALIQTQAHQLQSTNYSLLVGFSLSLTKHFPK